MTHEKTEKPIRTRRGPVTDPTPEEIAERSAEIRAEWSPEEHEKRSVRKSHSTWSVPECSGPNDSDED